MRLNKRWGKFLTWGSKTLILGVLLATVFAPLGQLFPLPVAQAAEVEACESTERPGVYSYPRPPAGCSGEYSKPVTVDSELVNGSFCDSVASCLAGVIYIFMVGLGSSIAYVGAWVMSLAVALSLSSTAYSLSFLSIGWASIRDIANMFFILILVYIALTVMFRAQTTETMQRLAWVIVIALVINFSFFFTRVVIDTGNLLAIQFYNSIEAPSMSETISKSGLQGTAAALVGPGANTKDLSASIMNGIGIQRMLNTTSFEAFRAANPGLSGFFTELITLSFIYIALGAMLFMLAAIFFTVGIKLVVRIVVLWFVIIVSPLALIARTLKQGEGYYRQWQDTLIKHAFYPAVFLFVFYILVLFMNQLVPCVDNAGLKECNTVLEQTFFDLSQVQTGGLAYFAPLVAILGIKLGFVVIILYIGLKASEAMGVMGASFARNVTGRIGGLARFSSGLPFRGALAGGAAFGRNTVGRGALFASRSQMVRNLPTGIFGRSVRGALGGLAGATYDARGIPGAGSVLGAGGLLNVGKAGGKGGYTKKMEGRAKEIETVAKGMKPDEVDIRNAQEAFERNYDDGNGNKGRAAFSARIAELNRAKTDALRDQKAAEGTGNKAAASAAKDHVKTADDQIKALQEGGKKIVEDSSKQRIREFAERVSERRTLGNLFTPTRGDIIGAAKASKLATEKSAKDKLAEAAAQVQKEAEAAEGTTPTPTTATTTTPAPTATNHPLRRSAIDVSGNKGPLTVADTGVKDAIAKLIKSTKHLDARLKNLTEATEHNTSSVSSTLKTVTENKPGPDFKVIRKVNERLDNIETKLTGRTSQTSPSTTSGTVRDPDRPNARPSRTAGVDTPPSSPATSNQPPAPPKEDGSTI